MGARMTRYQLEVILWCGLGSLILTTWFINLTNNHYQRGYADGYKRAKALHGKKDIK